MKILALDQSSNITGWSLFEVEGPQVAYIDSGKFTSVEPKLLTFKNSLSLLLDTHDPDTVVFEEIQQQRNVQTFKTLAQIQAMVLLTCQEREKEHYGMYVSTWRSKQEIGGANRTEKERKAREKVLELLGERVSTDEAEAILIGLTAAQERMSAF